MWLLGTTELNLHPYQPRDQDLSDIPFLPYAVLSHTWGNGGILFENLRTLWRMNLEDIDRWNEAALRHGVRTLMPFGLTPAAAAPPRLSTRYEGAS